MRIAVIGSGIAGISAAWALSREHHVTLIEASDRVGGHSRTLEVASGTSSIPVDTGFIVFNERNYPNLTHFFNTVGVETYDSDMSFSVWDEADGFAYAGRAPGLFPTVPSFVDTRRWAIARGLVRFRSEQSALVSGLVPDDVSILEYLRQRGYSDGFIDLYVMPLASAVWSGTRNSAAEMPARTFLQFLDNHGLVGLSDRPQWLTVRGGAQSYVKRAVKEITAVHTSRPVVKVDRTPNAVVVHDATGAPEEFDHVVFATHADVTLDILGDDASKEERDSLAPFRYDQNEVVLHTDASVLPPNRRLWSSWNAVGSIGAGTPVGVTYWMNRLQDLGKAGDIFVTLNPDGIVDERLVLDRWVTSHPQFTVETERAQRAMPSIQGGNRTSFAGAYLGHGFHEDGARSGFAVAADLGSPAPWWDASTNVAADREEVAW